LQDQIIRQVAKFIKGEQAHIFLDHKIVEEAWILRTNETNFWTGVITKQWSHNVLRLKGIRWQLIKSEKNTDLNFPIEYKHTITTFVSNKGHFEWALNASAGINASKFSAEVGFNMSMGWETATERTESKEKNFTIPKGEALYIYQLVVDYEKIQEWEYGTYVNAIIDTVRTGYSEWRDHPESLSIATDNIINRSTPLNN